MKIVGTTTLMNKSKVYTRTGKVHRFIEFELDGKREMNVDSTTYDIFAEGDRIYVEISKHSKCLLKIDRASN